MNHAPTPLLQRLKSASPSYRLQAIEAILQSKDEKACEALFEAYTTPNQGKKLQAKLAHALHTLRGEQVVYRALQSDNETHQKAAVEILGHFGDAAALPHLQKLYPTADRYTRYKIVRAWGAIGNLDALSAIRHNAFNTVGDFLTKEVCNAFTAAHVDRKSVYPWLIEELDSLKRDNVKVSAIILGKYQLKKASPSLARALLHPDLSSKNEIVQALAEIGGKRAIKALIKSLNNTPHVDLGNVAQALATLNAHEAIPALKHAAAHILDWDIFGGHYKQYRIALALEKLGAHEAAVQIGEDTLCSDDYNSGLHHTYATWLAELKTPRASAALLKPFTLRDKDPEAYTSYNPSFHRGTYAEMLGKIGAVEAVPVLCDVLSDTQESDRTRAEAAIALGNIKHPDALPTLLSAFSEQPIGSSFIYKNAAARAILDAHSLKPLQTHFDQGDTSTRQNILEALTNLHEPSAATLFVQAIDAQDEMVRYKAVSACINVPTPEAIPGLMRYSQDAQPPRHRTRFLIPLAKILGNDAIPYIQRAFDNGASPSTVVWALSFIDSNDIVPLLLQAVRQNPNSCASEAFPKLAELGAHEAVPLMVDLQEQFRNDHNHQRNVTLNALAALGAPEALPIFVREFEEAKQYGHISPVKWLSALSAPEAVVCLGKALHLEDDPNSVDLALDGLFAQNPEHVRTLIPDLITLVQLRSGLTRQKAIGLLGHINGREAIPALLELVQDSSVQYDRERCVEVLGLFDVQEAYAPILRLIREHTGSFDTATQAFQTIAALRPLDAPPAILLSLLTEFHVFTPDHALTGIPRYATALKTVGSAWLSHDKTPKEPNSFREIDELVHYATDLVEVLEQTLKHLHTKRASISEEKKDLFSRSLKMVTEAVAVWKQVIDTHNGRSMMPSDT